MRVVSLKLSPIAIADPPLRTSDGLHAPYATRTLVEIEIGEGIKGTNLLEMAHASAACPNLHFACEQDEVVQGERIRLEKDCLRIPAKPGLGERDATPPNW